MTEDPPRAAESPDPLEVVMRYHEETKHHFHQVFGFDGAMFQSLYHFTIGGHVEDPRLTTLPPYDLDH